MLITLTIWLVVTIASFGYGLFLERLVEPEVSRDAQHNGYSHIIIRVLVGFAAINIMASILSLITPLRLGAFLMVVIPPLAYLLFFILPRWDFSPSAWGERLPIAFLLVSLSMLLLLAWMTSGPARNADTYIYHAQSIRWIEEYPAVKGLGNFFIRLAYNSSWFVQSALFSFSFLGGQSYHVLNGLVVFWVSLFFWNDFYQSTLEKRAAFPQIMALLLIPIGFVSIGSQSSAPSTDLPVAYFGWLVVYLCIRYGFDADRSDSSIIRLLAISGLAAFTFTIKIYALPLLIFPLLFILSNHRVIPPRVMIVLVTWVLLIILPWMARNIVISGYAVYPIRFSATPVDWRMPIEIIEMDLRGIRSWGFNNSLPPEATGVLSYTGQILFWYQLLTYNQRILFFTALFFPIGVGFFSYVRPMFSREGSYLRGIKYYLAIYAGFLFWLVTSPNLRFGYIYLLFFFAATLAMAAEGFFHLAGVPEKLIGITGMAGLLIFHIAFLIISFDKMTYRDRMIMPMDYDERFVSPCVVNGGETGIWCASFYGECGYHYFPCHAWGTNIVFLYGDDFRDGFYTALTDETR